MSRRHTDIPLVLYSYLTILLCVPFPHCLSCLRGIQTLHLSCIPTWQFYSVTIPTLSFMPQRYTDIPLILYSYLTILLCDHSHTVFHASEVYRHSTCLVFLPDNSTLWPFPHCLSCLRGIQTLHLSCIPTWQFYSVYHSHTVFHASEAYRHSTCLVFLPDNSTLCTSPTLSFMPLRRIDTPLVLYSYLTILLRVPVPHCLSCLRGIQTLHLSCIPTWQFCSVYHSHTVFIPQRHPDTPLVLYSYLTILLCVPFPHCLSCLRGIQTRHLSCIPTWQFYSVYHFHTAFHASEAYRHATWLVFLPDNSIMCTSPTLSFMPLRRIDTPLVLYSYLTILVCVPVPHCFSCLRGIHTRHLSCIPTWQFCSVYHSHTAFHASEAYRHATCLVFLPDNSIMCTSPTLSFMPMRRIDTPLVLYSYLIILICVPVPHCLSCLRGIQTLHLSCSPTWQFYSVYQSHTVFHASEAYRHSTCLVFLPDNSTLWPFPHCLSCLRGIQTLHLSCIPTWQFCSEYHSHTAFHASEAYRHSTCLVFLPDNSALSTIPTLSFVPLRHIDTPLILYSYLTILLWVSFPHCLSCLRGI